MAIASLKNVLKQKLLSASAKALKVCMYYPDPMLSFEQIHEINNRAVPLSLMNYIHPWSATL